jgi:LuxR family maltose regulon positive regulatory protein
VEADLLKIHMMVLSGSGQKRIIDNLLREAVYYAYENRIMQPFFMERTVLSPLLVQYYKSEADDLNKGERQFLQDVIKLCSDKCPINAKEVLSARELEVLGELARGLTNPEIAGQLSITLATVKTHIINIFGKLGVSSRVVAVEEAKRRGLI